MKRAQVASKLRAAALRVMGKKVVATAIFGLGAALMVCAPIGRPALAAGHDFQFCTGYFALCAASTCKPTGKKIRVNVSSGGTALFPEADCTCPIFSGEAIADVAGGNMKGSCKPPSPDVIWSLYSPKKHIPQQINAWVQTPQATVAPLLFCSKNLNLGSTFANCFSFACDAKTYINGVPVATCHCPIGEGLDGGSVAPHTDFVTQAGQGDRQFCAAHPVAGPISLP